MSLSRSGSCDRRGGAGRLWAFPAGRAQVAYRSQSRFQRTAPPSKTPIAVSKKSDAISSMRTTFSRLIPFLRHPRPHAALSRAPAPLCHERRVYCVRPQAPDPSTRLPRGKKRVGMKRRTRAGTKKAMLYRNRPATPHETETQQGRHSSHHGKTRANVYWLRTRKRKLVSTHSPAHSHHS